MNKFKLASFILVLFLTACAKTETIEIVKTVEIEKIVQVEITRLVKIESTTIVEKIVTATQKPTITPKPTSEKSLEEVMKQNQESVSKQIISDLESLDDIDRVNLIRFEGNELFIEYSLVWASRDSQPISTWDVITYFSSVMSKLSQVELVSLVGSEEIIINTVSYSTDGDYRYQSKTNLETLRKINNRQISYDEWTIEANAGFR